MDSRSVNKLLGRSVKKKNKFIWKKKKVSTLHEFISLLWSHYRCGDFKVPSHCDLESTLEPFPSCCPVMVCEGIWRRPGEPTWRLRLQSLKFSYFLGPFIAGRGICLLYGAPNPPPRVLTLQRHFFPSHRFKPGPRGQVSRHDWMVHFASAKGTSSEKITTRERAATTAAFRPQHRESTHCFASIPISLWCSSALMA